MNQRTRHFLFFIFNQKAPEPVVELMVELDKNTNIAKHMILKAIHISSSTQFD